MFCEILYKIQKPCRILYFAKYFAKYSLPFLLSMTRLTDFTHMSHSIEFTHVWSKLFKKYARKKTQYKQFKNSCFTNIHFLFYKLPLWSQNTIYITFFVWILKIWLLSFLFWSFLRSIEEFHPIKSGVCGYYVKNILEHKFILFD